MASALQGRLRFFLASLLQGDLLCSWVRDAYPGGFARGRKRRQVSFASDWLAGYPDNLAGFRKPEAQQLSAEGRVLIEDMQQLVPLPGIDRVAC